MFLIVAGIWKLAITPRNDQFFNGSATVNPYTPNYGLNKVGSVWFG